MSSAITAPVLPKIPLVRKYVGTPTAAAREKQISWRLVKLNATFVLTAFKSFGTGTYGIISPPCLYFLFAAPFASELRQAVS